MGATKRLIEKHEEQYRLSVGIALQAKVLQACEFHTDIIFDGPNEIEDAYKLGNYKFSKGEMTGVFKGRTEMTDSIKHAVEDNHGPESCWACAKMLDD
jgi:hypothetical protein